jgi:antitoxin ParD1/3/4
LRDVEQQAMNVSLTPELERLVQEKVASGMYNSASEVVREALRLLHQHDELRRMQLEDLRREVAIGLEASRQGRVLDGDEVFERLRLRNEEAMGRLK